MSNRRSIPTGYPSPLRQIAGQIRCASGFTFDPKRGMPPPAPQKPVQATRRPLDTQRVLETLEGLPDDILPGQRALSIRLGTSWHTLLKRLRDLQDQGKIIYRVSRFGTEIYLTESNRVLRTRDNVGRVRV